LVLGPVFWLRPSPMQARQARMRAAARGLGLEVRLTELPQTRRARVRQEEMRQGAAYRLPVPDPRAVLPISHRVVREPGGEWEHEGDALPPALAEHLALICEQLPADAV